MKLMTLKSFLAKEYIGYDTKLIKWKPVKYRSVSLSPTLSRNKIVEQHIRKKIHKPNALRF